MQRQFSHSTTTSYAQPSTPLATPTMSRSTRFGGSGNDKAAAGQTVATVTGFRAESNSKTQFEQRHRQISFTTEERDVQKITRSINNTIMSASSTLGEEGRVSRTQSRAQSRTQSRSATHQDLPNTRTQSAFDAMTDLTNVTGYEGTSNYSDTKINRLKPKSSLPSVAGPSIQNITPSTRQKKPTQLQWSLSTGDNYIESVEFWPKYQSIFDKKAASFNLMKNKFSSKSLPSRDALVFCKDHGRTVIKQKHLSPKVYNQEITRQFPRENISYKTEKSDDWFKLYKNAISLNLAHPSTMPSPVVDVGPKVFRQEILIPAAI